MVTMCLAGRRKLTADTSRRKGEAEINPVTDHDTGRDQGALEHDHLASLVGAGRLRLPARYRRCVHAVAEAGDDASDDEMRQAEGRCLQSGADDHDGGADDDHFPATEGVADPDGEDRAEEASQVVTRDGDALMRRAAAGFCGSGGSLVTG